MCLCNINVCLDPSLVTITSSGRAGEKHPGVLGLYELDTSKAAQLKPVYKKTDRDLYIYYNGVSEERELLYNCVYNSWGGILGSGFRHNR